MHATVTVALPGDIDPEKLASALDALMERFSEDLEVELHRDPSVYAETFEVQLAKAKAFHAQRGEDISHLNHLELVQQWNGDDRFDTDGWPLTTRNPDGHYDWWVIGGRWGGQWVLREGAPDGPLPTDSHSFGRTDEADMDRHTDCARLADLCPESIAPSYAYIDLDGTWHHRWIGPTREEATDQVPNNYDTWTEDPDLFAARFLAFIQALPPDTWLVNCDYHH